MSVLEAQRSLLYGATEKRGLENGGEQMTPPPLLRVVPKLQLISPVLSTSGTAQGSPHQQVAL